MTNNRRSKLGFILRKLRVLLGNGEGFTNSIPDAVDRLLRRNYPEIFELKWRKGDGKLVIFIPDYYLISFKVVKYIDPDRGPILEAYCDSIANDTVHERKNEFKKINEKLFHGNKISHYGEVLEMELYEALKDRYEKLNENVVVFHGLEILKFYHKGGNNTVEKDFIIINATYGYIMAIASKKTLDKGKLAKCLEQLDGTLTSLTTYLTSKILPSFNNVSPDWLFVPMIYCENIDVDCGSFDQHVIKGIISP